MKRIVRIGALCAALGICSAWAAEPRQLTHAQAEKIALAQVQDGKVQSAELEREHGHLVWSFDISQPGTKNIREVQVDAHSGKIVAVETETPAAQAKEAAAENKATRKPLR